MAFPETNLLDGFNRADENPLAGIWSSTKTYSTGGSTTTQLQTNQIRQAATLSSSHTIQAYPQDQECWVTISTLANSDDVEVNARIRDPSAAGAIDLYQWVYFVATTSWRIFRIEDGSGAGIGPNPTTPVLAAGDSIGMRLRGSTIEGWHKPAAGAWTLIVSHVDGSPLIHPGPIGVGMNDADQAWRLDDFGGGAIGGADIRASGLGRGRIR
jgi:hypothetical protein